MVAATKPSRRRVARGIEAVIDNANHVEGSIFDDVWVDPEDLTDAVDAAKKLMNGSDVTVHSSDRGSFAIRLRL